MISKATTSQRSDRIKSQEILQIISEVSESISLTEKPNLIVEAALDSLSENLKTDCSWIQLTDPLSNKLNLVSSRNFTHEIHNVMAHIDKDHYCVKEIVGLGNRIVIPNLSMDGRYGLVVFEEAGFHSLIAVPIMTYKVFGIMGIAYRSSKKVSNEFTQLIAVIANLVGMALNKEMIAEYSTQQQGNAQNNSSIGTGINIKEVSEERIVSTGEKEAINSIRLPEKEQTAFRKHSKKMDTFRKLHN
ncbi:GAF domain-containing protein [Chloroflexota bacterium]